MLAQSIRRSATRNKILANLPLPDLACIKPFLRPIQLRERMVLQEPKKPVDLVYFIESGMASLRVVAGGSLLETAIVGFRGAVGVSSVFGIHVPNHQSVVLFPGSALSIASEDLRRVMVERPLVRENLASYAQALVAHEAQTALCGVRHSLEQRLASWLCLACDAVDGQILSVTHDYLSTVLGLRRAGVTEMLIRFEEQGLIRKMRGLVHVDDRKRLAQRACSCYGVIESAYAAAQPLARTERELQISS